MNKKIKIRIKWSDIYFTVLKHNILIIIILLLQLIFDFKHF